MSHLGGLGARVWHIDLTGRSPGRQGRCSVSVALAPGGQAASGTPAVTVSGDMVTVEMRIPSGRPGLDLCCRIQAEAGDLPHLQRRVHRAVNHRRSGLVIGAMIFLLAFCGWVMGGDEGARWAVRGAAPLDGEATITPAAMCRRFGARPLTPAETPFLFDMLRLICQRAGLPRMPALYLIPAPYSMNAYALGGPAASAITLTEGLLRGLSAGELRAILAHEVGHIRNNDAWAMTLAGTLHRATAMTSLLGLLSLRSRGPRPAEADAPLTLLLNGAPAIGRLLHLALSRIREFDADATAMELVDDPQALVSALHKLEHHHGGTTFSTPPDQPLLRWLHSHPATGERVRTLLASGRSG